MVEENEATDREGHGGFYCIFKMSFLFAHMQVRKKPNNIENSAKKCFKSENVL